MNNQAIFFIILVVLYLFSDILLNLLYKKRYKKDPDHVYKNPTNESHKFIGEMIILMQLIYIPVLVYHITNFDFSGLISIIEIFNKPIVWLIGLILGIGSIFLSIISRFQLGSSWRVGIDKNTNDKLITTGVYHYIRNPFFSSILGFQFSLILLSPHAITILNFLIGYILLGFQTRSEEDFLISKYRDEYLNYKNKTGRFLPKINK